MPQLEWDELDFLEVLGVPATIDDYGCSYGYSCQQQGLSLAVVVWPYESVIQLSIHRTGEEQVKSGRLHPSRSSFVVQRAGGRRSGASIWSYPAA